MSWELSVTFPACLYLSQWEAIWDWLIPNIGDSKDYTRKPKNEVKDSETDLKCDKLKKKSSDNEMPLVSQLSKMNPRISMVDHYVKG